MRDGSLRAVAILAPLRSHTRKLPLRRLNLAVSFAGGWAEVHGRPLDKHSNAVCIVFGARPLWSRGRRRTFEDDTLFLTLTLLIDGIFHIQIARDGESCLRREPVSQ